MAQKQYRIREHKGDFVLEMKQTGWFGITWWTRAKYRVNNPDTHNGWAWEVAPPFKTMPKAVHFGNRLKDCPDRISYLGHDLFLIFDSWDFNLVYPEYFSKYIDITFERPTINSRLVHVKRRSAPDWVRRIDDYIEEQNELRLKYHNL
jgi:hypothetical protein